MKTQMIRVRSDVRYIGSTSDLTRISVHLVQSLAEADLLYVTIYQTRAQLLARCLQADWSSTPAALTTVIWAIQGQLIGHEWHACTSCDECQLAPITQRHRCIMTPGCAGHLQRLVKRPILTARLRQILRSGANVNN